MEETTVKKPGGKREGQKYKPLLVWDILLKKTDENHKFIGLPIIIQIFHKKYS